jgi:hypothetical protein
MSFRPFWSEFESRVNDPGARSRRDAGAREGSVRARGRCGLSRHVRAGALWSGRNVAVERNLVCKDHKGGGGGRERSLVVDQGRLLLELWRIRNVKGRRIKAGLL